jgi:hypothetical protein
VCSHTAEDSKDTLIYPQITANLRRTLGNAVYFIGKLQLGSAYGLQLFNLKLNFEEINAI